MTAATSSAQCGTVTAFDAGRGLGEIEADTGDTLAFHCVEIADGTREIDIGARVTFTTLAKFGRYEAAGIRREC